MSIINDALKKAQKQDNQPKSTPAAEGRPGVEVQQYQKKKSDVNWGPFFVLAVLLLITGPIVAPLFSSPFRNQSHTSLNAPQDLKTQAVDARKAQFGIEEAPANMMPLMAIPNLAVTGIVYSDQDSYCIINGKILKVGDKIQGAKLVDVTPMSVTLEYHGERLTLPIS